MAPTVRPSAMDMDDGLLQENIFDEITRLATSNEILDGTAGAGPQPAVVVQDVSQDALFDAAKLVGDSCVGVITQPDHAEIFDVVPGLTTGEDMIFDPAKLTGDSGVGGERPVVVVQAEAQPQDYYSLHTQPGSPEFMVLQPAAPDFYLEILGPASAPQQATDIQPASELEILQQALSPAASPQQPLSPQQLDLPEHSVSFESVTVSPSDTSVRSPSPSCLEETLPSPAPQQAVKTPKKRGRKRKYPEGMAPSRRRPKKTKVYEMGPLHDDKLEKKRKNAVNAKKHRDAQKAVRQQLTDQLTEAKAELDILLEELNQVKQREEHLLKVLSVHGIIIDGL